MEIQSGAEEARGQQHHHSSSSSASSFSVGHNVKQNCTQQTHQHHRTRTGLQQRKSPKKTKMSETKMAQTSHTHWHTCAHLASPHFALFFSSALPFCVSFWYGSSFLCFGAQATNPFRLLFLTATRRQAAAATEALTKAWLPRVQVAATTTNTKAALPASQLCQIKSRTHTHSRIPLGQATLFWCSLRKALSLAQSLSLLSRSLWAFQLSFYVALC